MIRFIFLILLILIGIPFHSSAKESESCTWDNRNGVPCVKITKPIPNVSKFSKIGLKSYIITSKEIKEYGATDVNEVLEMIPGLHITQSGPKGQQTSLFTRGTGSNHTLVLLNGIPINDQSTTQGLHDFGVDFIQSIHQIEIYTGPNGAHFGPNAIGGAISIQMKNGFDFDGAQSQLAGGSHLRTNEIFEYGKSFDNFAVYVGANFNYDKVLPCEPARIVCALSPL